MSALVLLSFALPVLLPFLADDNPSGDPPDGEALPDFVLPAVDGSHVKLSERAALHSAVVLVFHRGQACPSCEAQLTEYQSGYATLRTEGAELLAISLGSEQETRGMAGQTGVRYPMLYDGATIATVYGLAGYLTTDYTTVTIIVGSDLRPIGRAIGALEGEILPVVLLVDTVRQAKGTGGTRG